MPTPPSRRRPITPPARRPKVAGLRKPDAHPAAEPSEATDIAATPDAVEPELSTPTANDPQETATPPADPLTSIDWSGDVPPERVGDVVGAESGESDEIGEAGEVGGERSVPSPRPAGKRRAAGVAAPRDLGRAEYRAGAEQSLGVTQRAARQAAERNRAINLAIALGVLALVLAGLAIWFRGQADTLTSGADVGNKALTDVAATSEVRGKLTVAIEKTLSYNYADLEGTANAVKTYLSGTAVSDYDKLFCQVKKLAPAQKLVVTAKVRDLGVTRLDGDKADVLVFLDQTSTRADQNQTSASGAQFGIRAEKIDGTWKITDFDMLDQPLPDGSEAANC